MTFIGADIILANLLSYSPKADNGISEADIADYCQRITEKIMQSDKFNDKVFHFSVSEESLDEFVNVYPEYFKKFLNKYYRVADFNIKYFERRVDSKVIALPIKENNITGGNVTVSTACPSSVRGEVRHTLALTGGKLRLTVSCLVKHPRYIAGTPFHTAVKAIP